MSALEILEQFSDEVQTQTFASEYVPRVVYDDGNDDHPDLHLRMQLIELCDKDHCAHA